MSEIRICSYHQDKERTPLIWTFAFNGAEYWCPACGANYGMLGAGESVKSTKKLVDRLKKYKQESRQFLRGNSLIICAKTKYRGVWMTFSEMPKKAQTFWRNKAKSWVYKYE